MSAQVEKQKAPARGQRRSVGQRIGYAVVRALAYVLMPLVMPVKIIGRENLPTTGGFLVVCNHVHAADPVYVLWALLPRRAGVMAKEELFLHSPKLLAAFLRMMGAVAVKRGSSDLQAMRAALEVLGEGRPFLLFPEGTRSPDGRLGEFHAGVGLLAQLSRASVVPMYLRPYGKRFLLRRQTLIIGKPLCAQDFPAGKNTSEKTRLVVAQLRTAVQSLAQKQDGTIANY